MGILRNFHKQQDALRAVCLVWDLDTPSRCIVSSKFCQSGLPYMTWTPFSSNALVVVKPYDIQSPHLTCISNL